LHQSSPLLNHIIPGKARPVWVWPISKAVPSGGDGDSGDNSSDPTDIFPLCRFSLRGWYTNKKGKWECGNQRCTCNWPIPIPQESLAQSRHVTH